MRPGKTHIGLVGHCRDFEGCEGRVRPDDAGYGCPGSLAM